MTEILRSVRKILEYPRQRDLPKPPNKAQLYSGEGAGFIIYLPIGIAASRLIEFAFSALLGDHVKANHYSATVMEAFVFLALIALPFILNYRDPKWSLWIWRDGAILQRGSKRIELSKEELSQIREVDKGRLCLELHHGKKRIRLPLTKTANLLGKGELLWSKIESPYSSGAGRFKSSFDYCEEILIITLYLSAASIGFVHREYMKSGEIDFLLMTFLVGSTAAIAWKLYSMRPTFVKLTEEGIARQSFPPRFIIWEKVKAITIDQSSRKTDDSLSIEADGQVITIPASTPNYWQLEKRIMSKVPSSAKVTRV